MSLISNRIIFFNTSVPISRLTTALNFAKSHGMGMEMEWDNRVADVPDPYLLPNERLYGCL